MLASATVETLAVPTYAGHPELVHVTPRDQPEDRRLADLGPASATLHFTSARRLKPRCVFGDLQG
jgi:hypothetical protein